MTYSYLPWPLLSFFFLYPAPSWYWLLPLPCFDRNHALAFTQTLNFIWFWNDLDLGIHCCLTSTLSVDFALTFALLKLWPSQSFGFTLTLYQHSVDILTSTFSQVLKNIFWVISPNLSVRYIYICNTCLIKDCCIETHTLFDSVGLYYMCIYSLTDVFLLWIITQLSFLYVQSLFIYCNVHVLDYDIKYTMNHEKNEFVCIGAPCGSALAPAKEKNALSTFPSQQLSVNTYMYVATVGC